jgi:hypothetical protein
VRQVLELGDAERSSNNLVVAWIVRIHVNDEAMNGLNPDPDVLDLVGRMGGDEWCTTRDRFTLRRPDSNDAAEVRALLERRHDDKQEVPQR